MSTKQARIVHETPEIRAYRKAHAEFQDAKTRLVEATKRAYPLGMPVVSNARFYGGGGYTMNGTICGHGHEWSDPGYVVVKNDKTGKTHKAAPFFLNFTTGVHDVEPR